MSDLALRFTFDSALAALAFEQQVAPIAKHTIRDRWCVDVYCADFETKQRIRQIATGPDFRGHES